MRVKIGPWVSWWPRTGLLVFLLVTLCRFNEKVSIPFMFVFIVCMGKKGLLLLLQLSHSAHSCTVGSFGKVWKDDFRVRNGKMGYAKIFMFLAFIQHLIFSFFFRVLFYNVAPDIWSKSIFFCYLLYEEPNTNATKVHRGSQQLQLWNRWNFSFQHYKILLMRCKRTFPFLFFFSALPWSLHVFLVFKRQTVNCGQTERVLLITEVRLSAPRLAEDLRLANLFSLLSASLTSGVLL